MGSYVRTYTVDGQQYELYLRMVEDTVGFQLVAFDGTVLTPELLSREPTDAEAATLIRELRHES